MQRLPPPKDVAFHTSIGHATRDKALSLPQSHYLDKVTRTSNMMDDIFHHGLSFSAAGQKHGLASAEEAGIAMAVVGVQTKMLLEDRKVYKQTMLLTLAKHKDGLFGCDLGELYSETWNERKEEDGKKSEAGIKRNAGQLEAQKRGKEMKGKGGGRVVSRAGKESSG